MSSIKKCYIKLITLFIVMLITSNTHANDYISNIDGIKSTTVVQLEFLPSYYYGEGNTRKLDIIEIRYDRKHRYNQGFDTETWAVLRVNNYKQRPISPYYFPENQNYKEKNQTEKLEEVLYLKIDSNVLLIVEKLLTQVDFSNRFVVDVENDCGTPTANISYQPSRSDTRHSDKFPFLTVEMDQTIFGPCSVRGLFPAASEEILAARNLLIEVIDDVIENGSDQPPLIIN